MEYGDNYGSGGGRARSAVLHEHASNFREDDQMSVLNSLRRKKIDMKERLRDAT